MTCTVARGRKRLSHNNEIIYAHPPPLTPLPTLASLITQRAHGHSPWASLSHRAPARPDGCWLQGWFSWLAACALSVSQICDVCVLVWFLSVCLSGACLTLWIFYAFILYFLFPFFHSLDILLVCLFLVWCLPSPFIYPSFFLSFFPKLKTRAHQTRFRRWSWSSCPPRCGWMVRAMRALTMRSIS